MSTISQTSDERLLELLAQRGALGIAELAEAMSVTATAIRQRLSRLMEQELVEREATNVGRGRPSHRYSLTEKARRRAGSNFADLAIVLWDEVRAIKDVSIRRGLLERLAQSMARLYQHEFTSDAPADRFETLRRLFDERRIPLLVESPPSSDSGSEADPNHEKNRTLPVLTVVDCPYPDLAAKDRGVCAMEKMLFAELLQSPVRLAACRLDGHDCCQFETA